MALLTGSAVSNRENGNKIVGQINNADVFSIDSTTITDTYAKLGETFMIFYNENGPKYMFLNMKHLSLE